MRDGQLRDALVRAGILKKNLEPTDNKKPLEDTIRLPTGKYIQRVSSPYYKEETNIVDEKKDDVYRQHGPNIYYREHFVEVPIKDVLETFVKEFGIKADYTPAKEAVPEKVGPLHLTTTRTVRKQTKKRGKKK